MILGCHPDHVDANDAHNGDLKLLVCDDLEQQKLEFDLRPTHASFLVSVKRVQCLV